MTFIPHYTSTANVQPGPLVDASPIYNALASVFGNVAKTANNALQQRANVAAQDQGFEAGMAPNFKPSDSMGEAAQVYNQAGLQAQKLTLGAEIGSKVNDLYNEASQNLSEGSIATYNAALQGYGQSILNNTPAQNKPYIQALLLQHGTQGAQRLQTELVNRNKIFAYGQGMQTLQSWQTQAENAAANGNQGAATAYYTQAQKMADSLVAGGMMPKGAYASLQVQGKKQLLTADVIGQYQTAANQGKGQDFIQSFLSSKAYDAVLSPMDKESLINRMKTIEKTKLQAAGITNETISNLKKNVVFQAQNGQTPSAQDIATINAYDPDNSQNLANDISLGSYTHSLVQNGISSTIGDMQATVKELNTVSPDELQGDNALKISLAKKAAAQQIQQYITQFPKDPMGTLQSNPNYKQMTQSAIQDTLTPDGQTAVNQFVQNGPIAIPTSADGVAAVQNYIQKSAPAILSLQKYQGIDPTKMSLISNAQAAQIVSQVRSLPAAQQVQTLNNLQQVYGQYSQYVFPKLVEQGLPQASNLLVAMQNNPQSVGMIPAAMQAFSTPTNQLQKALPDGVKSTDILTQVKSNLGDYINSLQGYNGLSASLIDNTYKQVNQLALQLVAQGEAPNKAAQDAASALINNHYQFSTFNGHTYRVPYNVDKNLVNQATGYMKNLVAVNGINSIKVPTYFYPDLQQNDPELRKNLYLQESVAQGYVVTNSDDSGLTFVDRYGAPVTTANNQRISVSFSDIANPSSEFRQTLAKTVQKGMDDLSLRKQLSNALGDYAPLFMGNDNATKR
jgi:polyhydroxyalkanoate synthesis regulator phasin